jgi:hypothetical protein
MRVAEAEPGAGRLDRQVELDADDEVLAVHVAAEVARRQHAVGLGGIRADSNHPTERADWNVGRRTDPLPVETRDRGFVLRRPQAVHTLRYGVLAHRTVLT